MSWFAFDIDEYDADTMHLSAAQDGAYMRLLRFYYKTRLPLPDNDQALANIARISVDEWEGMKIIIRAFFKSRRGRLHSKRADRELDREDSLATKRSEKSRNAAQKRHSKTKTSLPRADSEHEPSRDAVMLGDATRPDQTLQDKTQNANPATTCLHSEIPALERNGSFQKFVGFGSGISDSGQQWSSQQKRDEFAATACIPHLPGRDDGERWALALAAEDPQAPDHEAACRAMRMAAKKAGVGWVSPTRRAGGQGRIAT